MVPNNRIYNRILIKTYYYLIAEAVSNDSTHHSMAAATINYKYKAMPSPYVGNLDDFLFFVGSLTQLGKI